MTLRIARFLAILARRLRRCAARGRSGASDTLLWRAPVSGGAPPSADWGGFKSVGPG
jgi:hypothetical protein